MKKKLLISLIVAALFICLFVVGVSAEGTAVPTFDEVEVTIIDTVSAPKNITDLDAKIMLKRADGTYVVYPSYYMLNDSTTAYYNLTRCGIKDSDGNDYTRNSVVRLQVPQSCTSSGNQGFNKATNLIEVDFGANSKIEKFEDSSFAGNTSLVSVRIPDATTKFNAAVFNGCTSLRTVTFGENSQLESITGYNVFGGTAIEEICFPASLVSITGGGAFYGCASLRSVTFASGSVFTTLSGAETFKNCKLLEEVIFPNTLTTLGNSQFHNCTALKTINFGASIKSIGTNQFAGSVKTSMYISNTLFTTSTPTGNLFSWGSDGKPPKFVYYTGSLSEATALLKKIEEEGNNKNLVAAKLISMDDFSKLSEEEKTEACYFIYDVNKCDAFYKGVHTWGKEKPTFKGQKYVTDLMNASTCTVCLLNEFVGEPICGPLFDDLGYSTEDNGTAFAYAIIVNSTNIDKYIEATGDTLVYGFIVGLYAENSTGDIINANGEAQIANSLVFDFTEPKYDNLNRFELKFTNITNTELGLYCNAYVINDTDVSYIGAVTEDYKAQPITFANLPKKDEE